MIPRLHPDADKHLLAILRKAGAAQLSVHQACLDFAGIVARFSGAVASARTRSGRGRKANEIRILAELAADTYWKHTGKGPGRALGHGNRNCGHYPAFVRGLAEAASISFDERALHNACREVQRSLNTMAALPTLNNPEDIASVGDERARRRGAQLDTHVLGFVNSDGDAVSDPSDGDALMGGYEPAPDQSSFDPAEVFKQFGAPARGLRSARQAKRQSRSQRT